MKLMCVLIAALFLTACQVITAGNDARDLREFPRRKMRERWTGDAEMLPCKGAGALCGGEEIPTECCEVCVFNWCT
uniref:Conotoxin n=1 Tax=Conus praecellens TaxID=128530 RepID=A0A291C2J7_CONPC|nr:conotoxin [Conus praecellens]